MACAGGWIAILVRVVPRIERYVIALQIGAVPVAHLLWLLDQCLQALLRAGVIADVELVEIEYGRQPFDRISRDGRARAAELLQHRGCHQADQQSENDNDDQQLQQCEAAFRVAGTAPMSIPLLACMATAAAFYHLPPRVLPSIQAVEGGYIGAVHADSDGSQDLGIMQVNTRWLADLAQVARMSEGEVRERLIYDGCFNIAAAAAILRAYLNEARGDLMLAVGYYHSHTPALNLEYQSKVLASAARLFGTGTRTMPHATHADANN